MMTNKTFKESGKNRAMTPIIYCLFIYYTGILQEIEIVAEKSTILDAVDSGMADVFTQWCAHNQQGEQKGAVVAEGLDKVVVASQRFSSKLEN